ncbi:MAG: response regulator [Acidobacteriia bacterium]|nr:response regulator [Terriglobia bacterium]
MTETAKPRVLFVDDEPDLLEALARNLRSEHFAVSTASGGAVALEMLQQAGPFAVIVSDLRMPEMDGVTLLRLARQSAPETIRVLFTGQPDLERSIAAVNEGAIFRFLTKPCSRVILALTLKAAVEQYRLVTAERVLLEQTLHGSIQALTDVLSLTAPLAFGRAARLRQTVRSLASASGVVETWPVEVAAMLSQVGCVILPPATLEKVHRGEPLSEAEQTMVRRMPAIVEQVLGNIPRLEPVREILRLRDKPFDGGSRAPGAEAIPWGARALKLAFDLDVLESEGTPASLGFETLRARPGWYDPDVLQKLVEIRASEQSAQVREVPLAGLLPGMVMAQDVRTHKGDLFVARGQEVSASLVEKLRNFAASEGQIEEVCLVKAKPAEWLNDALPAASPGSAAPGPSEPPAAAVPTADAADPVTGLPGRAQAEAALSALCQGEKPAYLAVLVLDSLPSVSARFGRRAGDALLRAYGSFIAEVLAPEDRLFRWSGPALVALLPRLDDVDRVRGDFRTLLDQRKFQHAVRTSTRSIPLTASPRWTLLPAMESARGFIEKIDTFVGALTGPEEGPGTHPAAGSSR